MKVESIIPIVIQLLILLGTIYSIRQARPKQAAEIHAADSGAAKTLSEAAALLGDEYKEQFEAQKQKLEDALDQIDLLNQRLGRALEDKARSDAFVRVLDQKASELSIKVVRHSAHLADLLIERDQTKAQIKALREENEHLHAESDRMCLELAEAREENSRLRARVDRLTQLLRESGVETAENTDSGNSSDEAKPFPRFSRRIE